MKWARRFFILVITLLILIVGCDSYEEDNFEEISFEAKTIVVPEGNILIGRAAACWPLDFGFPWLPENAKH